jgi:hypothetical protein
MRTLYIQLGDEPSKADPCVGFAVDWHTAQALCQVANGDPLVKSGPPEDARRWEHLREMAVMANWIEGVERAPGD